MKSIRSVAWVVPYFDCEGSGGIKTLHDHIKCLSDEYNQTIYMNGSGGKEFADKEARNIIERRYGRLPDNINVIGNHKVSDGYDLIIATFWRTADKIADVKAGKKAYFVQDLEYMFYPMSYEYMQAYDSYSHSQGLTAITIGTHLKYELKRIFNVDAHSVTFGVDTDIYKPIEGLTRKNAVCFLFDPNKPRRLSELGIKALNILKEKSPETIVYLYGSAANAELDRWYPNFINLGLLSLGDLNKLYNICSAGLCFSATNPSRIPYEMLAADLPVVDIIGNNKVEFDDLLYLTEAKPEAIADQIIYAMENPNKVSAKGETRLEFCSERTLDIAFNDFRQIIKEILT